jgi:hypothetical protein
LSLLQARELIECGPDGRPLEAHALGGQELGDVLLELVVSRALLPAPDVPEIGPAEEERPAGLEQGVVRAGGQDEARLGLGGEDRHDGLVRPEVREDDVLALEGVPEPFDVGPDQDRVLDPVEARHLGFALDEAEVLGEALEIGPGSDVGGQGELGRRGIVGDDDGQRDLVGQPVAVGVLEAPAEQEEVGQAAHLARGGAEQGGQQQDQDQALLHGRLSLGGARPKNPFYTKMPPTSSGGGGIRPASRRLVP